jgi:hypothetical protein
MTRAWPILAILIAGQVAAARLDGQQIDVSAYGVAASNAEISRTRQARGLGLGAAVGLDFGRYRVDIKALTASLNADFSIQPDYAVNELSFLATYRWRPVLSFQLGAGRRFTSPDFVAQEVGVVRVGLLTETPLSSKGRIWARAAYLPLTRFSGGGGSDLSLELGMGVRVGPSTSRFSGVAEYTYQRIDRQVNGGSVPIRFSELQGGVRVRL